MLWDHAHNDHADALADTDRLCTMPLLDTQPLVGI